MKCSNPVLCHFNGKVKIYRNFSAASPMHRLQAQTIFDCNKCIACRQKYARQLAMRCVLHASLYEENCFITLTYDESQEGYTNAPTYADIQNFKKRLRQKVFRETGRRIEIFNVMEYGKNKKKHWHLICFNYAFLKSRKLFFKRNGNSLYTSTDLDSLWKRGISTIGDVSLGSAMYQAQYTQKDIKYGHGEDFRSVSKHSGLGRPYFLKNFRQILSLGYIPFDGQKLSIPRYFLKIAHKHYAHFYDRQYFHPSTQRKLQYKFLCCNANKEMADLYLKYLKIKEMRVEELSQEWKDLISQYIYNRDLPDFVKSGQNRDYDLQKRFNENNF